MPSHLIPYLLRTKRPKKFLRHLYDSRTNRLFCGKRVGFRALVGRGKPVTCPECITKRDARIEEFMKHGVYGKLGR